jgi:flavin-dependent dehydrogenase
MDLSGNGSRTAIAGAGITGAYLYRLLRNRGYPVDLYDVRKGTGCGLHPCAWGTSGDFMQLVTASGLDPKKYVLRKFGHVLMDDVRIRADLMTIDKPGLVRDLLQGADVNYTPLDTSGYDRVIDATGVSRAFLPSLEDDIILSCVQYRIKTHESLENRIRLGAIGYAWSFPLSDKVYHVGCGSLVENAHEIMAKLNWLGTASPCLDREILCECEGKIRLTGPRKSLPFVTRYGSMNVWGMGEAIGCVAPLAGDGIAPGMKSARILMDTWENPEQYTRAVLKEFQWMEAERRIIDKLVKSERLGIPDAWVLKKNSRRMGMRVGIKEASRLMRALR